MDLDEEAISSVAIACSNVNVSFGQVRAVVDASLALTRGDIHALVGENGAGKSTLSHVLAGLRRPDEGEVRVSGQQLRTGTVQAARELGVAMVQQHDVLPRQLTVAEALELFEPTGRGVFRRRQLNADWSERLAALGVNVDAGKRLGELPVETVQAIDIARALSSKPRVLILDEPTSLLAPQARDRLFHRLRMIAAEGVTVVVVLHKLSEVYAVADTVTVMRAGCVVVGPTPMGDVSREQLVHLMTGRDSSGPSLDPAPAVLTRATDRVRVNSGDRVRSTPVLRLDRVCTDASRSEPGLHEVTIDVGSGEVVGIAAISGNGERLTVEAAVGLIGPTAGDIQISGQRVTRVSVGGRRRLGMSVLPFDRNREAISRSTSLWQNVAMGELVTNRPLAVRPISTSQLRRRANEAMRSWNVKFAHVSQRAGALSGGNAQRLVLARELHEGVQLLVAANPTTGLDLASTEAVRGAIAELRTRGVGVLLVTQDLDELLTMSDRVVVLHGGAVAGEFAKPFSLEAIASAMLGASA